MSIALHPLTLLNISDHYTRQTQVNTRQPSLGILTGFKTDITHIINSFELVFNEDTLDVGYLEEKINQFSTIYPDEFVIGAYIINLVDLTLDHNLTDLLKELFKDVNQELNFLVFNPVLATQKYSNAKFLKIFNSQMQELKYDIVSKEAEKISVDTVLSLTDSSEIDNQTSLKQQVEIQKFTLVSIERKIKVLKRYLESEPTDYAVLRSINALISSLLNFKASDDIKSQLADLENNFNFLLTLGSINENLMTLSKFSSDFKKTTYLV